MMSVLPAFRQYTSVATFGFLSGCVGQHADSDVLFLVTSLGEFNVENMAVAGTCAISNFHVSGRDRSKGTLGFYSYPPYDDNLLIDFSIASDDLTASEVGSIPESVYLQYSHEPDPGERIELKVDGSLQTEFEREFGDARQIINAIPETGLVAVFHPNGQIISEWSFDGEVARNAMRYCMSGANLPHGKQLSPDLFRGPDALGVFWQEPVQ
ncbi:MAG: hypothetical protein AAGA38_11840 [Pseudomonadota bacterium]